jgi:hypothetical protein
MDHGTLHFRVDGTEQDFEVKFEQKENLRLFIRTQCPKPNSKISILHEDFYHFDVQI